MTRIPRLHLISDRKICPVLELPRVAALAVTGGVDAVHIREPGLDDVQLRELTNQVCDELEGRSAHVLVNRSIEVAATSRATGIQLAEQQIEEIPAARQALGSDALIGVSVHSVEAAQRSESLGADFVIAGHVYETGSKPGQVGRGLEFVREVSSSVRLPVIAIGGITPERVRGVLDAGAYGVAVLSGILVAEDPEEMSRLYARAIAERLDIVHER
jgi:thiazole tautomerase (transcriptional regulator TenI)